MKIDLYKLFGVEEGEEFKLKYRNDKYIVENNKLYRKGNGDYEFKESEITVNDITMCEVIKLPNKKQFTDDELCILRNVDKGYKWIARDEDGELCLFNSKPNKLITENYKTWENPFNTSNYKLIEIFNHIFNSIQWEDTEPVCIDDYVER